MKHLPLSIDIETKAVLKKTAKARAALAELKGFAITIPNNAILTDTLALQEAKDSSEIENIITTHDELFKAELDLQGFTSIAAKEVQNYSKALKEGFRLVKKDHLITISHILSIHKKLEDNDAGFRKLPGTELRNDRTGETVYVPPQNNEDIKSLMANLLEYINDDELEDIDPLIKMAIIHHQFESIHPFYDGNGRTGRIINILYLVAKGLLDFPVLYLSRYIIQNKGSYYRLLQKVREEGAWEEWVLYILQGVIEVSKQSINLIGNIKQLMSEFKFHIRDNHKFYSQDLINNLFKHPYTKIEFLQNDLDVTRQTAAKYLNILSEDKELGILKLQIKNENYYVNTKLFKVFQEN